MTTREAAARRHCSTEAILSLIRRGRLRATKVGRDWYITEKALAAVAGIHSGRPRKATTP